MELAQHATQSFDLAQAEAKLLRCLLLRQSTLSHAAQDLEPVELSAAHRQGPCPSHVDLLGRRGPQNPSF
jgi:hypothetical protein